jgi:hypothetical protein
MNGDAILKRIAELVGDIRRIEARTKPRIYTYEPLAPRSNGGNTETTVNLVSMVQATVTASSGSSGPPSTWLYDVLLDDGTPINSLDVFLHRSDNIKYQPIENGTVVLLVSLSDDEWKVLYNELPEEYACA